MKVNYRPDLDLRPQLRFAAQNEFDELVRSKLRKAADELSDAIAAFWVTPTGDNLTTTINGAWASAVRILNNAGLKAPKELA